MIRFGIIGTNFITDTLLDAAKLCPDFELKAVYSRTMERAQAFAAKHGAELVFDDLEAFAACDQIDAVYVASPNCCHAPQSIFLMEHGKHVLCEKPIASNSRELAEMIAASKKNGVVLLEAMRPLHTPAFTAICENLHKLGTVRRVYFDFSKYSSRYDKFKSGIIENAFNPALSNSSLMDIGVYCAAPMVAIWGMPEKIVSSSVILHNGMEGSGVILASYPGMQASGHGMLAELVYSKITDSKMPNQIEGEDAAMLIDAISTPLNVKICYRSGKTEELDIPQVSNNMCYELNAFIGLIQTKQVDHKWNEISVMEMQLLDEVRRQQNIVFPADQK